jgi:molybdopterin-guanine dinucleotide biosynthesis protein A
MQTTEQVNAVVFAGGMNDDELTRLTSTRLKALISFRDSTLIQLMLENLREVSAVRHVAIVGDPEAFARKFELNPEYDWLQEQGSFLNNLRVGLEALPPDEPALLTSCDIPLADSAVFDNLLTMAENQEADIIYPIIRREVMEKRFPGARRTYVKLSDGTFTGGNAFLAFPKCLLDNMSTMEAVLDSRKSPMKLASLFGWSTLIKIILGRASLSELEKQASRVLDVSVKALPFPHAELGMDIDKCEDLEYARQKISRKPGIAG